MNPLANGAQAVSPFPPPPDYAHYYTTERLTSGSSFPPPPVQSEFTVFGEEYRLDDEIISPLSTTGIKQLYPTKFEWKAEMKKLNRSVVVAFVDLLELLIRCPDHAERLEKLSDIQTIFINMHHLINEYRPLQARDIMKFMQQEQLQELEGTVERFRDYLNAGRDALREELSLDGLRLEPVPMPSSLTGITLDSDDENEMPVLQVEKPSSTETSSDSPVPARTKSSTSDLRTRTRADSSFLERK